jgi:hypothetical protein
MKVAIKMDSIKMDFELIEGVTLNLNHGGPEFDLEGAENMVLADREELRQVLEHSGESGGRSSWCNWPGCGWSGEGTEHTCPLREEA